MFKTPKDFSYDKLIDSLARLDYKIAANDAIQYKVFANNGFKLIDLATSSNINSFRNDLDVIVASDGTIKMPLIGRVSVIGLTVKEAEKLLESKYSGDYYVDPYITLKITNKRVIVFPGVGGAARSLTLGNDNTTVLEAIASAGGIAEDGKAYKVKLIRNNPEDAKKPFVYLMDLSEIQGVSAANSKVQAGDVIYVEPRYRPVSTLIKEITPLLTLLTTALILYQFSLLR
jgi:polysaccharide biosynthesis/export protein